jgi:hypothetical protein
MSVKNIGKWFAVILLLVLIYFGWKWWSGSDADDARASRGADPSMLLDRIWIDGIPEGYTDYMNVFVALGEQPIGVFQKASSYRLEAELFQFRREGGKMAVIFPQTSTKKSFSYKISYCDDLPPFDLCLDIDKNPWGGPRRYYGDSEETLDAALALYRRLLPAGAPEEFQTPAR